MAAKIPNLLPNRNGFVTTVMDAYNRQHAPVLRPDDVWIAGMVGTRISSSGDLGLSPTSEDDTVSSVPGWWIFIKKDKFYDERDEIERSL
jgi:hypothetical protein